jgi:hypothetical protein
VREFTRASGEGLRLGYLPSMGSSHPLSHTMPMHNQVQPLWRLALINTSGYTPIPWSRSDETSTMWSLEHHSVNHRTPPSPEDAGPTAYQPIRKTVRSQEPEQPNDDKRYTVAHNKRAQGTAACDVQAQLAHQRPALLAAWCDPIPPNYPPWGCSSCLILWTVQSAHGG